MWWLSVQVRAPSSVVAVVAAWWLLAVVWWLDMCLPVAPLLVAELLAGWLLPAARSRLVVWLSAARLGLVVWLASGRGRVSLQV